MSIFRRRGRRREVRSLVGDVERRRKLNVTKKGERKRGGRIGN